MRTGWYCHEHGLQPRDPGLTWCTDAAAEFELVCQDAVELFVPQRGRLFETVKGSEKSHYSVVVLAVGVSGINCDAVWEHDIDWHINLALNECLRNIHMPDFQIKGDSDTQDEANCRHSAHR